MDQAAKDRIQHEIEHEANERFPGAVQEIRLLEHGDDPVVEPGEVVIRITLAPSDGSDGPEQALHSFEQAHGAELSQFRRELLERVPQARRILVVSQDPGGPNQRRLMIRRGPGDPPDDERRSVKDELTPVMASLEDAFMELTQDAVEYRSSVMAESTPGGKR